MIDVMYDLPSGGKGKKTFEVTKAYAQERIEKADLVRLQQAV